MPDENLTEIEKRNLKLTDEWAAAWNIPGRGSEYLVNELYADSVEVFSPIQSPHLITKKGESKDRLVKIESFAENLMEKRNIIFHHKIARGNTVAIEAEIPYKNKNGKEGTEWFAGFLTFDDNGKIHIDHTFIRNNIFSLLDRNKKKKQD